VTEFCAVTRLRPSGSRSATGTSSEAALSHCAGEVRTHAPDRYLATLLAPPEAREALFALYAFDHEIGKVRHIVREPMAGLIRLQWWRDALDAVALGAPPGHPVAEALAAARLPEHARSRLHAAIDARERELEDLPFADHAALEAHLEATGAGITLVALDILDAGHGAAALAGRHLGLARGTAELLRAAPDDARARLLLPPAEGGGAPAHRAGPFAAGAASGLVDLARGHVAAARRLRREVPRQALPALLPGTLTDHYLRRLARAGHDPSARRAGRPMPLAPLSLLVRCALGRY